MRAVTAVRAMRAVRAVRAMRAMRAVRAMRSMGEYLTCFVLHRKKSAETAEAAEICGGF